MIKARLVDENLFKQTSNKNIFGQKKFYSISLYPFAPRFQDKNLEKKIAWEIATY